MLRLGAFLRNPFSFLFARSAVEERVATYLIREHARGRRVDDILADRFVRNRLSAEQQGRLLSRPDVLEAIGEQVAPPRD